jgi:hypothetical protein
VDVPVQYFQSVIAIELAVAGALLFEIRFFDRSDTAPRAGERRPHPGILILFAVVLSATLFGSLAAMLHGGQTAAASAVTIGLAISLLPILLRVLPPLLKGRTDTDRHPQSAFTVVGLLLYVAVVAGVIVLLNT